MKTSRRTFLGGASAAAVLSSSSVSFGQKKYDDGASDSEIKIGHTCPYSGPASAYGVNGKAIVAFWDMINDTGGINGRKIKFITLDDGYSPPKTVEMHPPARRAGQGAVHPQHARHGDPTRRSTNT